jgi:hypothetical protein
MTVSITTNRSGPYTTDGVATGYAYSFPINEDTDLRVFQRTTATGAVSELTLNVDFTVSGAGDPAGGTVTIAPAIASGYTVLVLRAVPMTQEVDLSNQGGWFPEVHEGEFDLLTFFAQDMQEQIDRCVKIGPTEDGMTADIEGDRDGYALGFDVDGNPTLLDTDTLIISGTIGTRIGVNGANSLAQGTSVTASGENSQASGYATVASGYGSHTEGASTTASGTYSHAEGSVTVASGLGAHAEGSANTASGGSSHAEGGGNTASGTGSHAEGTYNTASADSSHAEGGANTASGAYSHAEGNRSEATGGCSHAEGYVTQATADYAHAEGRYTEATADYSHAEGQYTVAEGLGAHAEGSSNTATGIASHAEGYQTTSVGDVSHAEGHSSSATGDVSHAEGESTTASGDYSHAEGCGNAAAGDASHAGGGYSSTTGYGEQAFASGRFATTGDCQTRRYMLRGTTTDDTPTVLASTGYYVLPDEHSASYSVRVIARQDTGGGCAVYWYHATLSRTDGTMSQKGSTSEVHAAEETSLNGTVALTEDDTNKCLTITVTGVAATNIRWAALVEMVQVGYSD